MEYFNLKSPLNEQGVFVADEDTGIDYANPYVKDLPSMTDYLNGLRQQMQQIPDFKNNFTIYEQGDYSADMNLSFPELLKQEGLNIIVTSELRPGARTKQGKVSHHSHKDEWGYSAAIDFRAADGNYTKLLKNIYSNPRIVAWLINHKKGILEETMQHPDVRKNSGADKYRDGLLHLGPDKGALRMSRNWGVNYNAVPSYPTRNSNTTYTGPIDGKMGSKAFPLGGGKTKMNPNGSYTLFHTFGYGTDKRTKRSGVDCSKKVINTLIGYMNKGCNTLQDLIMMYHLGMKGTWNQVKSQIKQKGGLRDQGSGKWISADEWIQRPEAYQKQCADYMHMPMNTRVSKSSRFLYPLVTFISRQEQGVNSEAATAIALQEMRIA